MLKLHGMLKSTGVFVVRRFRPLAFILFAFLASAVFPASAQVQKYVCIVIDHDTGVLYDCDLTTGLTSRPRPTGIKGVVGIVFSSNLASRTVFVLTDDSGKPVPDALYSIDPYSGRSVLVGKTGLHPIQGGDLVFNTKNQTLYAAQYGPATHRRGMMRINPKTGAATVVFSLPAPKHGFRNINSLTFNKDFSLFYATDSEQQTLLAIDPATARILTEKPLSDFIGARGSLRLNRYGDNRYYFVDGGMGAAHALFVLDVETAVLAKIGDLKGPSAVDSIGFIPKSPRLK